jgi:hypothetical protein
MSRRLAWLLTVPLMAVSLFAGHELAYAIVGAPAVGHGYFTYLPFIGAILLTLALTALVLHAVAAFRGDRAVPSPPLAFALLPAAAFVLQEHLERLLYSGAVPWWEPTFAVGLAVQLPFGLVALLLARLLQSLAQAVGVALAAQDPCKREHSRATPAAITAEPRRLGVLARGYGERAPPLVALSE